MSDERNFHMSIERLHLTDGLYSAIEAHDLPKVKTLLEKGADVDYSSPSKGTPLSNAICYKQEDVVACLIEHGCNVNAKDYAGETPISVAVRKKSLGACKLLVDANCRLNCPDPVTGLTPLSLAIQYRCYEIASLLLASSHTDDSPRCDIDYLDKRHYSALHYCVSNPETPGSVALLRQLLSCGCYLNQINLEGHAPVHKAVQMGHLLYLEELIKELPPQPKRNDIGLNPKHPAYNHYCNIHSCTTFGGNTVLHLAVMNNDTKVMRMLISCGINLNANNMRFMSPLHIACEHAHFEACQLLLEKGACPNGRDSLTIGAVFESADPSKDESSDKVPAAWLKTPTPLHIAISNEDVDFVKLLVTCGADVNLRDDFGHSALIAAARAPDVTMLDCLLQAKGARANVQDMSQRTSLDYAAIAGNVHAIKMLVSAGADVCRQRCYLRPSIYHAISEGHVEAVSALIEAGSDMYRPVSDPNRTGRGAYNSLLESCHPNHVKELNSVPIARLLLQHGADPDGIFLEKQSVFWPDFYKSFVDPEVPVSFSEFIRFVVLLINNGWQSCRRVLEQNHRYYDLGEVKSIELLSGADLPDFSELKSVLQLRNWIIREYFSNPRSLAFCCRQAIRKQLVSLTTKSIRPHVQQLPLCQHLKQFILHVFEPTLVDTHADTR